jgi:predicted enzyme related to lactoylglutathione lyase
MNTLEADHDGVTDREKEPPMLRGLTTVNLFADDVAAARGWYAELLGLEPYFVREMEGAPVYVEFRIGDYQHELGIVDRRFAAPGGSDRPGGAVIYWHVDDVQATFNRLLAMGAAVHEAPVERGPGFVTASVVDPFGNVLAVMYNRHYLDTLEALGTAGAVARQAKG